MMPISRILIRIFAWKFYRENSGMLLFVFVAVLSYCLFIKTAGVYQAKESVFYHLMLMMTFLSSPFIMLLVFILWAIYTIKSWQYLSRQLKLEQHQFLFYSLNAVPKHRLFTILVILQLIISLPLVGYCLFAAVLAILYQPGFAAPVAAAYILLLCAASALLYLNWINKLNRPDAPDWFARLSRSWRKPFFLLPLFHIAHQFKIPYLLTKAGSWCIIAGLTAAFLEIQNDYIIAAIIMLSVVVLHSFIIYKDYQFKEIYLPVARNLPYHRTALFSGFCPVFILLALPEFCWVFSYFDFNHALGISFFGLSVSLLFRNIVYMIKPNIYRYLIWVFVLFILLFYACLTGHILLAGTVCLAAAFLIFYFKYYRPTSEVFL